MASPVNQITNMTYDATTWSTLETTNLKFANAKGLSSSQLVSFPTSAFSARDPALGNIRQYALSKNLNDPGNPPFGLLVNNSEKPAGVASNLYESFADYDVGTNTATLHNGFSFSSIVAEWAPVAYDVMSFTLIYEEQEPESESSNTLQQLNNQIHTIRNQSEMASKLDNLKSHIKSALNGSESESYYKNHTGRELYRKLSNFEMESEITTIGDDHDAGFRPLTVDGIKA